MDRLQHYKTQIGIIDDDHKEIYAMIRDIATKAEQRIQAGWPTNVLDLGADWELLEGVYVRAPR